MSHHLSSLAAGKNPFFRVVFVFLLSAGFLLSGTLVSAQGPVLPPQAEGLLDALPADHFLEVLKKSLAPTGPGSADASKFNGTVTIGGATTGFNAFFEIGKSAIAAASLSKITGEVASNALSINIPEYSQDHYFPGIIWRTGDNNPTKPKLGIWGQMNNKGSRLYLGTSNNYAMGITNQALTIDESGRVGIGTTAPAELSVLDVAGAIAINNQIIANTNDTSVNFGDLVGRDGLRDLRLMAGDTERVRIKKDNGNVGIGNTSPGYKLTIGNDSDNLLGVSIRGHNTRLETMSGARMHINADALWLNPDRASNVLMTFGGGNVGIGTGEPYGDLEVTARNRPWGEGVVIDPSPSGYSAVFLRKEGTSGGTFTNTWALSKNAGNTAGGELFQIAREGLTGGRLYRPDAPFQIKTSGEALFGFNVGIGITDPAFKLDIGTTLASKPGFDKLATQNIELFTPQNPGAGDGIITLHHGNRIAHQLRYNNGTLFLEGSTRPDYGTSSTPAFTVGGTVTAGALSVGEQTIGTRTKSREIYVSGPDDIVIPLGKFNVGTSIQVAMQAEGGWAERGAQYFLNGYYNNLPRITFKTGNEPDRLIFYGKKINESEMFLWAKWINDSPKGSSCGRDKGCPNYVRLLVTTSSAWDYNDKGDFTGSSRLSENVTVGYDWMAANGKIYSTPEGDNMELGCRGQNCWSNANGIIGFPGYGIRNGSLAFYPNSNAFALVDSSAANPAGDYGALSFDRPFNDLWAGNGLFKGNVGIGTTSPQKKLHITGTDDSGAQAIFNNDQNDRPGLVIRGNYPEIDLISNATGNANHGATLRLGAYDDSNKNTWKHWVIGTPGENATHLDFGYAANQSNPHFGIANYDKAWGGSKGFTVMSLNNSGNVGIGTTVPGAKLDVRGATYMGSSDSNKMIKFTDSWTAYPDSTLGSEISNDTSYYKTLMLVGNKSAGGPRSVSVWDILNVNGAARVNSRSNDMFRIENTIGDETSEADIRYVNSVGNWEVGTNQQGNGENKNQFYIYDNNYRFTVQRGTGNVGIGTTGPESRLTLRNGYLRIDSPGLGWGKNQRIQSYGPLSLQPDTDNTGDAVVYLLDHAGNEQISFNARDGIAKANKFQLGDKWLFSGVGDAHANDGWLRMFNKDGTGYSGGIAMNHLWVNDTSWILGNLILNTSDRAVIDAGPRNRFRICGPNSACATAGEYIGGKIRLSADGGFDNAENIQRDPGMGGITAPGNVFIGKNLEVGGNLEINGGYTRGGTSLLSDGTLQVGKDIFLRGNLYRENIQELLVKNNTLVLNAGGSPQNAYIKVDKTNGQIKWNQPSRQWDISSSLRVSGEYPDNEIDNQPFKGVLRLDMHNSDESNSEKFDESKPSYGIEFRRKWHNQDPYNVQAGIYAWGSDSWSSGLAFRTAAPGPIMNTNMVITGTGNVGIGTNTPAERLTVRGNGIQWTDDTETWRLGQYSDNQARSGWTYFTKGKDQGYQNLALGDFWASGTSFLRGDVKLGANMNSAKLFFGESDTTKYIAVENWWMNFHADGNEGWKFIDNTGDVLMQINGLGANNGNVGIGASPDVKLNVNGTAAFGKRIENVLKIGPFANNPGPSYFTINTKIPFTDSPSPQLKITGYNYGKENKAISFTLGWYVYQNAFYWSQLQGDLGYYMPSRVRLGTWNDAGTQRVRIEIANDGTYWSSYSISAFDSNGPVAHYDGWAYVEGEFPGNTGNITAVNHSSGVSFTNNGNVGIGNSDPQALLDVNKWIPSNGKVMVSIANPNKIVVDKELYDSLISGDSFRVNDRDEYRIWSKVAERGWNFISTTYTFYIDREYKSPTGSAGKISIPDKNISRLARIGTLTVDGAGHIIGNNLYFSGSSWAGDTLPYARLTEHWGMRFNSPDNRWVFSSKPSVLVGYAPDGRDWGTGNLLVEGKVGVGTDKPKTTLDVVGITKTQKFQIGEKWLLSGVGDAHGNDEWLRIFNTQGTGYYGGIAMNQLWVGLTSYFRGKAEFTTSEATQCCIHEGDAGSYTISISENTVGQNYTRSAPRATIQFHNAGEAEGFIRLAQGSASRPVSIKDKSLRWTDGSAAVDWRRFIFGSWQTRMSGEFTGNLYVDQIGYFNGSVSIGQEAVSPCVGCKLDVKGGDINVGFLGNKFADLPEKHKIALENDRIGLDVAELFESEEEVEVGDVVIVGENNRKLKKSSEKYQGTVVGVVSGAPALLFEGSELKLGANPARFTKGTKPPVALTGRIPVKVSLENGPIKPGDYLTSSSTHGVAMKATEAGMTIGVALERYDGDGDGKILVFLNVGETNSRAAFQELRKKDEESQDLIHSLEKRLRTLERRFRW